MSDDDITRLRTLAQADAAARHRAMQWHADQRLTDQDDDEVHHTTEALRARLDGFVILELLDRQQRDKPAPRAEPVGHLHSNGDFCWKRSIAPEIWPVPLYEAPPDHTAPMRQALDWLQAEQRAGDDDCVDPGCDECNRVTRPRQKLIDALRKALEGRG